MVQVTRSGRRGRSALARGIMRVGGFSASVLLTGIVSLVSIPFVIVHTGGDGWASVAVGQSLGAISGIFTLLGWAQSGPTDIAQRVAGGRGTYFFKSLYVRGLSLIVTLPITALGSILLDTSAPLATMLSATSILAINLGANWFYIGESNPRSLLYFDAIPRSTFVLAATASLSLGVNVEWYAGLVLLGAIIAAVLSIIDIRRRYGRVRFRPMRAGELLKILRRQRHGIGSALLSAVYLSLPLLVVQASVPSGAPYYALADKLKQQALTMYRPISQTIQGWTPKGGSLLVLERVRKAYISTLVMGVLGGLSFGLCIPFASHVFGGGDIPIGYSLGVPVAIAFAANIVSLTTGVSCLLPLGLERHITLSAALGMCIALISIFPLVSGYEEIGAAWAVAGSQVIVAAYQSVILTFHLNRMGEASGRIQF
ncbi:putative membrane protein [Rhodococcus opacus]|uniref:Putative membrane protein n=1 Tax=Rhodococcus opacus TaxID=37919 RepID=A0A1B1K1D8_RHOOP|nr:hypothetical protein [Rhodococcus opacus]ANS26434.1 putative membrane protein [Rhodococcus opacus]